jgi:hypothetical protein
MANAELSGAEPKAYLKQLLLKRPNHSIHNLEELLPGSLEIPS